MVRCIRGAQTEDIKLITDNFRNCVIPTGTDLKWCREHDRDIFVEIGLGENDLPDYIDKSWAHYEKPEVEGGYFVMDIIKFFETKTKCATYVLLIEDRPVYLIADWTDGDNTAFVDIYRRGENNQVYEENEKFKKSYGTGVHGDFTRIEFKNPESKIAKKQVYEDHMIVWYRNGEMKTIDFFDENN